MGNQFQLIGSTGQYFRMADVTSGGRLMVDVGGDIVISGVSIDNIVIQDTVPTDSSHNNPSWSMIYDNNGNLGSVYQMVGTGSYVNTITWVGYSGVNAGIGSRVTNISNWSVV